MRCERMLRNWLIIICLILAWEQLFAQEIPAKDSIDQLGKKWILRFQVSASEVKILSRFRYEKSYADSIKALQSAEEFVKNLHASAYLSATYEKPNYQNDTVFIPLKIGEIYRWAKLQKGNVSETILNEIGFKEKYFIDKPFIYKDLEDLKQKILRYSENHGFPFATIQLDSLQMKSNQLKASLLHQAGPAMRFDTLIISGDAKLKQSFLRRFLKIKIDEPFNQSKVDDAERLLKQLPYIEVVRKPSVGFASERAFVNLVLNKRPANQADGILGIQPNTALSPNGQTNQLLLTGEVNLALKNLFASGKNFRVKWQRLQVSSQLLDLEFENPVLFRSNFDFKINFNLTRQDSTFVNNEFQFSLLYNLPNSSKLSFSINNRKSNLGDARLFVTSTELPNVSEIKYFSYILGYDWNNLDDFFYPKRGNKISFSVRFGNKTIVKNRFLADTLYNNLNLKSNQVLLKGEYARYFPLSKRATLLTRVQSGLIFNENLFFNDLYRFGGLNTLRGHNENSFFASSYAIATTEYRFFFEPESYFFLFYDQGIFQRKILNNFLEDAPSGAGVGVSFAVKAGIFNLVYALGQGKNEPFSFNRSKIHFGVVSRF